MGIAFVIDGIKYFSDGWKVKPPSKGDEFELWMLNGKPCPPESIDNGHMEMYAGNGDIVDSAYEGWSADTMALRPGQAARDLRDATSHNGNSYVMRYVGPNAEQ